MTGSRSIRLYFFLAELLFELDLLELFFEADELFFEPLELPDFVGIDTLPSGSLQQFSRMSGSEPLGLGAA